MRTRQQGVAAVHPAALVPQQDVVPRGNRHNDGGVDAWVQAGLGRLLGRADQLPVGILDVISPASSQPHTLMR